MNFELTMNTDNAAFENYRREIARILRETADRIDDGREAGFLIDLNGNVVGEFGQVDPTANVETDDREFLPPDPDNEDDIGYMGPGSDRPNPLGDAS